MPNDKMARERGIADPRLAAAAVFLRRYDRQVAELFLTQAMKSHSSSQTRYHWTVVRAKASVDPRGAVAMIESLPPGGSNSSHPTNYTRDELATCLAEPIDEHWKVIWSLSGVPVDGRSYP